MIRFNMFQPRRSPSGRNLKICKTSAVFAYFKQISYLQNIILITRF